MELNNIVKVTLTERGARILNETNQSRMIAVPFIERKTDYKANEAYEFVLWELFSEFGSTCSIGQDLPFTNLEVLEGAGFKQLYNKKRI